MVRELHIISVLEHNGSNRYAKKRAEKLAKIERAMLEKKFTKDLLKRKQA